MQSFLTYFPATAILFSQMEDQFTSVQWDDEAPWDTEFHREHTLSHTQDESQLLGPDEEGDAEDDVGGVDAAPQEPLEASETPHEVNGEAPIDHRDDVAATAATNSPGVEEAPLVNQTIALTAARPTYALSITILHPRTVHEGADVHTEYEVYVETDNPALKKGSIFRRYSDFDFLHQCLALDFPTLLVPPLPNKKRLEYIKGGRFTDEFIAKRLHSLNLFMERIVNHPVLSKSEILMIFLNDDDDVHWKTYKGNLHLGTATAPNSNVEGLTDYIMNSFKKPTTESKYASNFNDVAIQTRKLEENVNNIDRIYSNVVAKQGLIANGLDAFGDQFAKLSVLLQNDITGKHSETPNEATKEVANKFTSFSNVLKQTSHDFTHLNHLVEYQYLNNLRDLEHYIGLFRQLVRAKDAKILDYEALLSYLDKTRSELLSLQNGGPITNSTEGALSYWTKRLERLAGMGAATNEDLVQKRMAKLNDRIKVLEFECDKTKKIYETFEVDVLNEWGNFQTQKDLEITQSLEELTQMHRDFYQSCLDNWNGFPKGKPEVKFENKLGGLESVTGEGAAEADPAIDKITRTQHEINEGLRKLGIE